MKNKNKNNKKGRNYVFTIHNYTKKDLKSFRKLSESLEKHNYICYGLELGESKNTPHIQGYIQLKDNQRFTFLHKYFNFTRNKKLLKFHIQHAHGTQEDSYKYTGKEGEQYEFGIPKKQGKRTDMIKIKEDLKNNPRDLDKIIKEDVSNLQQLKFAENIQGRFFEHRSPNNPPVVIWLYGASGVGKTSLVYKCFDDVCSVSDYKWIGSDYEQNECLLFDDFRVGKLDFDLLLKITDRYPLELSKKFSSAKLNSPFIIFTSPKSISQTFSYSNENLEQLKRRIIEIDLDEVGVEIDLKKYTDKVDK